MNATPHNPQAIEILKAQFELDLRAHLALCEEAMDLATRENLALADAAGYRSVEFSDRRKNMLPRLERSVTVLRDWRRRWQGLGAAGRAAAADAQALFENVQSLLMKVLLLDRANQQALLGRGRLPVEQLRAATAPHFVTALYQRHAR